MEHFWETQFTQQALRKHFSCHDSITKLRWWGDGAGLGIKMEERGREIQEENIEWDSAVKKEATGGFQLNVI